MTVLRPSERRLVAAVEAGRTLDLSRVSVAGPIALDRVIRADVIRAVLLGRLAPAADPIGIRLRGAHIAGELDVSGIRMPVRMSLVGCRLEEPLVLRGAEFPRLALAQSWFSALSAQDLTVPGTAQFARLVCTGPSTSPGPGSAATST